MASEKPTLFLDVDGVLNVFARGYHKRAVEVNGERFPHLLYPSKHTLPFMSWAWNCFDVYWCTAWGENANCIAKWAALPQRPCVADVRSSSGEWKLDSVKAFVEGKKTPSVWIEDGIGPIAEAWAAKAVNFLYVHTEFRIGVTRKHAACLADILGLSMEAWK